MFFLAAEKEVADDDDEGSGPYYSDLQALILLTWTVKQQWLLSLLAQIQRISFDQDLVHYDIFFN